MGNKSLKIKNIPTLSVSLHLCKQSHLPNSLKGVSCFEVDKYNCYKSIFGISLLLIRTTFINSWALI